MSSRVLVITPTLNRPKLCRRALESVKQQTHDDIYYVIVLNGADDDKKVTRYKQELGRLSSWVWLELMSPEGLGRAINYGMGIFYPPSIDYWTVLEDDDEWDSDFLSVLVAEAQRTDADVTHCLQRQVPRRMQSPGGPMDPVALRRRNWINWPECLFKVSLYQKVGPICEECGPATDWDWHLRCVKAGAKYHFVNEVKVTHHWHSTPGSPNYCLAVDGKPHIARRMREGVYD